MWLLGFKREKHYLSVVEAQNILKYGFERVTIDDAVSREIDDLETSIRSKSESGYRAVTRVFQGYNQDLVNRLVEHFREKGFTADTYINPKIQSVIILIVGW